MEEKQVANSNPGKSTNTALILIIVGAVLAVLIVAGIFGSRYVSNKAEDKIVETADEEGRGGGSSNNPTSSPGQPVTWPTDLPAGLPQYSGGTVENSGKTVDPGSWSIQISGTTQAEFDAYKNLLLTNGWTIKNPDDFRANNYLLGKTGVGWDLTILYNSNGVLITLMEQVGH